MDEAQTASRDKFFVSYRRADNFHAAADVAEELKRQFGSGQVFFDVHDIHAGSDFTERLRGQLAETGSLIALIGKRWLRDEHGIPRLESDKDWVRIEISTALAAGARLYQVLIDDAPPLREDDLPVDLAPLARIQAVHLRNLTFRQDLDFLIWELRGRPRRVRDLARDVAEALQSPRRFVWALVDHAFRASLVFLVVLFVMIIITAFPIALILPAVVGFIVMMIGWVAGPPSVDFYLGLKLGRVMLCVVTATVTALGVGSRWDGARLSQRLIVAIWLGVLLGALAENKTDWVVLLLGKELSQTMRIGDLSRIQWETAGVCLTLLSSRVHFEQVLRAFHWAAKLAKGLPLGGGGI